VPDKHTFIGTFTNIDGEFTIQGKKVFPDGREEEGSWGEEDKYFSRVL